VDDSLDAREMYCMQLKHDGFDCVEAANGEEALQLARIHRPALAVMDATMPVMDGWQAVEAIRADDTLRGMAVVMLTAHAFDTHRLRAQRVGADVFLAKPIVPADLTSAIKKLLRLA
jgi:CheY-like chemotaxis protein